MTMPWFFPSWNGDVRAEAHETDPTKTRLLIIEPTLGEQKVLTELGARFKKDGWYDTDKLWSGENKKQETCILNAPLKKVAKALMKALKPGKQVLSAVVLKDGKIEAIESGSSKLDLFVEKAADEGKAAATVKRATMCCPQCVPGSIEPAKEVLLSFLDDEEHESWAKHREITVYGGLTGHAYLLAHRNSRRAHQIGRICYDLDDGEVVHFHDWTVPPEEEILAAKLMLEHAEPWLRNEASLYGAYRAEHIFKNPFGDGMDGTRSAGLAQTLGAYVMAAGGATDAQALGYGY